MPRRLSLFALVLAAALHSQDFRSTLQGTVSDPSQSSIANAAITLRSVDTGQDRTTVTNADGFFIFQLLPPGNYELTVKAAGFRTSVEKGISLALTQTLRQDVALQIGDTADTVNVVANVAVLETDTTSLGTAIRS